MQDWWCPTGPDLPKVKDTFTYKAINYPDCVGAFNQPPLLPHTAGIIDEGPGVQQHTPIWSALYILQLK